MNNLTLQHIKDNAKPNKLTIIIYYLIISLTIIALFYGILYFIIGIFTIVSFFILDFILTVKRLGIGYKIMTKCMNLNIPDNLEHMANNALSSYIELKNKTNNKHIIGQAENCLITHLDELNDLSHYTTIDIGRSADILAENFRICMLGYYTLAKIELGRKI